MLAVRERFSEDPQWQKLRKEADEAARVAQHAAQKAGASEAERAEKRKPYLSDPLFAYLWNCAASAPRATAPGCSRECSTAGRRGSPATSLPGATSLCSKNCPPASPSTPNG